MEVKYQVFISSTYADLQDERHEVMQALLELDAIPAGMELFPAANEDQWTLIKKVIDDCDYYVVIIAGRYGSIGTAGLSYMEMEYRYAIDIGKPVIGFVHRNPDSLPVNRCEASPEGKDKLKAFKAFVQTKMCRFWDSPADLGSQVSRSLVKLMKSHPGIGWVRGNLVPDRSAAEEILKLKKTIESLEDRLEAARTKAPEGTMLLAQGLDYFTMHFRFVASLDKYAHHSTGYKSTIEATWDKIFSVVSPLMIDECSDGDFRAALNQFVAESAKSNLSKANDLQDKHLLNFSLEEEDFQTVKIQLRALGLIAKSSKYRSVKDTATYWALTPYGDTVMTRLRAIPRSAPPEQEPDANVPISRS